MNMNLHLFEGEEAIPQEAEAVPVEAAAEPAGDYSGVMAALAQRLGVAPGDPEALANAIRDSGKPDTEAVRRGADRLYRSWLRQAEAVKQLYPEFDLGREMNDPRFVRLLRGRVDLRTAYETTHSSQILPAAMEYAARAVEQRLAGILQSAPVRPTENGADGSGAFLLGSGVSAMSRQDYDRVCRMVEHGQRISFG